MTLRRITIAVLLCVCVSACSGRRDREPERANAATPALASARPVATFRDDAGRDVALPVPLKRAVVFNRYTTEFIRAIAGMDAVAGFDVDLRKPGAEAYWPGTHAIMVVGQAQSNATPNYEAIVDAKPDVVFFARNGPWEEASRVLAPFHIPVFVITGWDVLKHEWNVELLGQLFGQPQRAAKLNTFYRQQRDLLKTRLDGVAVRKRVYIEEVGDYKALLKGSGWHDMVETGGGINVFGDINILDQPKARGTVQGFETDAEEILARRPDVLIKLYSNQYIAIDRDDAWRVLQQFVARPGFASLAAVKTGQVYSLSYYHASACSKIVGALQIAKWLYPERFADVNPDEAMRVWLEEFQGVPAPGPGHYWTSLDATTTTSPSSSSSSSPSPSSPSSSPSNAGSR
jgi:iron complex transport system substrate-binding protein